MLTDVTLAMGSLKPSALNVNYTVINMTGEYAAPCEIIPWGVLRRSSTRAVSTMPLTHF